MLGKRSAFDWHRSGASNLTFIGMGYERRSCRSPRRTLISIKQAQCRMAVGVPIFLALVCAAHAAPAVPVFSDTGPEAEAYGAPKGFPVPSAGSPTPTQDTIVGLFSHFDRVTTMRAVPRSDQLSVLKRAAEEISLVYHYDDKQKTIGDYLDEHPVTGLIIARDTTPFFMSTTDTPARIRTA